MAVVRQRISASAEATFSALCDPRTYPEWLVGAKEIRAIDDNWPARGSKFHHRVGLIGPLTVEDNTRVLEVDEPRRLVLEVRARPFGRGTVKFEVHSVGPDSEVILEEHPIGALRPFHGLLDPLIASRNRASLTQLAELVEEGALERPQPSGDR